MYCTRCGHSLQRMQRRGFLQKRVYPRFGYYPWHCPYCREPMILKKQHENKKHRIRESTAD